MRLWVLLCGLRGALLALGIFIVQGSQGWGISQWESGVQGLVLASGFTVTTPGKNHSVCKAKCSSAGEDGGSRGSAALQIHPSDTQ